jgi:NAD(P)-dependent dehydrogenase (short-subunit alcohol dehydrogenase family)
MAERMSVHLEQETGVAWIAGVGASAGLGAAVARRYAKAGLTVALSGRTSERIEAVAAEIRKAGGRAHALVGDLSDEAQAHRVAAEVVGLGPLRAAVFNAGNAVRGAALDLSAAQFEQAWRGGAFAGFVFAREVIQAIQLNGQDPNAPHGRGSLVITGATASLRGGAKFAAFASSKAALRSLAQSLAREHGPQGIHVSHVVIDGGIDGERLHSAAPQRASEAGADGLLAPDAIAETYWQLHQQQRSAWTFELDLRPFKETF